MMQFHLQRMSDHSEEALLNELRRVASLVKTANLSQREFRKHSRVAPSTITKRFGNWHKAIQAAGLDHRIAVRPSAEEVVAELRRVAALAEAPKLTRSEFKKHSRLSPETVDGHFGNWQKALNAAGLSERFDSSSQRIPVGDVLTEIKRVAELLGVRVLTIEQFDTHAKFTHTVARRAFGTWHEAMEAAGLTGNPRGKSNTDDECFENLLVVWTYYGRQPMQREMSKPPSTISASVYAARFGGWIKTLEAFVDRVNVDNASEPNEQPPMAVSEPKSELPKTTKAKRVRVSDAERREIKLGLRYTVLKRDCFRCVVCGRSPATHIGVVLHVDHILAWSKCGGP